MKCKVCGAELMTGAGKCPVCGNKTVAEKASTFTWNVQDFPKPKKKADLTIDWSAGKITDRSSGKVYSQGSNSWTEPDEVKNLFNFDVQNEKYQQELDRQMETIAAEVPPAVKAAEEKGLEGPGPSSFELPSAMDMGMFKDLIDDDVEIDIVNSEGVNLFKNYSEKPAAEVADAVEGEPELEAIQETGAGEKAEVKDNKDEADINEARAEKPAEAAAEVKAAEEAVKPSDSYSPEEESRAFSGLQKLMAAEARFKEDMERVTYLSAAETAKAEKIESKNSRLTILPTISFRSIEDEYEAYRNEHKDDQPQSPENPGDANKEVQIKISEPSGTQVTVKTQEINLAGAGISDNSKTREVQLDQIKTGPKNVQVSVEVSGASGNASVEVTRRHDGATLVKTIDDGAAQEHLFVNDEEKEVVSEEAELQEAATEEIADADISLEEAAEVIADAQKETEVSEISLEMEAAEEAVNEEPASDTVEAVTEADAASGNAEDEADVSAEAVEESEPEDEPAEAEEVEEAADVAAEAEEEAASEEIKPDQFWEKPASATRMTITDIFGPEARKVIDRAIRENEKKQEVTPEDLAKSLILDISPADIHITDDQTQAIMMAYDEAKAAQEAAGAQETVSDEPSTSEDQTASAGGDASAAASEEAEAEVKAEVKAGHADTEAAASADNNAEKIGDKATGSVKDEKESDYGKYIDQEEERGMSGLLKAILIIFALVLVGEFSIFGIKLLAPDSGAAVFIDRVEEQVLQLVDRTAGSDDAESADNGDQAEDGSGDAAQPEDSAAAPADGGGDGTGNDDAQPADAPADTAAGN